MSVINDTLKALELRGGRGAMPQPVNASAKPAPRRRFSPLWLLPPLLAAALWAWWPTLSHAWRAVPQLALSAETVPQASVEVSGAAISAPTVAEETASGDTASKAPAETLAPAASTEVTEAATTPAEAVADPAPAPAQPEPSAAPAPAEASTAPDTAAREVVAPVAAEPMPDPKPKPAPKPAPQVLAIQPSALSAEEQAQRLWQRAGEEADPEPLLEEALSLAPNLHEARLELLGLQGQRGSVDDQLMAAARAYPDQAGYPLLAAQQSLARGETELAGQWLDWSTRLTPDPQWRAKRAALAQQLGRLALAKDDYLALLKAEPQRGAWWLGLGYARDSERDLGGAKSAYRQALESDDLSAAAQAFARERLTLLERR
ncbi:hypothetical protein [Ferrimonas balearica]|uniref:hypothetical protein n=1 Tax=Ferrimonas balearica TaxID=44012 RepID=UPI001C991F99|nr:hypothetical protein [Ferrimonas balearica]MBY5993135.1 hypothetical protein [Ferrimonas balearica]